MNSLKNKHARLLRHWVPVLASAALAAPCPIFAETTYLQVRFSEYVPGPVAGQAVGIIGPRGWVLHKEPTAEIVPPANEALGIPVLAFSRDNEGSLFAQFAEDWYLASQGKDHIVMDVLRSDSKSSALITVSHEAATRSQSFGVVIDPAGTLRVNVSSTEPETTRINLPATEFSMDAGEWYRLEWEIDVSAVSAEGTFTLSVQSEKEPARRVLMKDQPFAFHFEKNTRLYLAPSSPESVQIANIGIYGDMPSFPPAAWPEFPPKIPTNP